MNYTYSYLIANITFVVIWLFLYLYRKDFRKEMLAVSFMFGIAGLLSQPIYIRDWWRPLTVLGTKVSIEDFIFGFFLAGVASVIYEFVFKVRLKKHKINKKRFYEIGIIFPLLLASLFFGTFMLGLHSFLASVVAILPFVLIILFTRRDLFLDALVSGILMVLIGFFWFWLPEFITPGWVENYWQWNNISGFVIARAPIEDLIWVFLCGAYIGPLYEYWNGFKLVKITES